MEEWQRRMVDPNWGGGKFGSYPGFAGPVGSLMLAGALPGLGYRQFWKGGKDLLSMSRRLSPQQLLQQMRRRLRGRDPSLPTRKRPDTFIPHHIRHMLRPQYGGPKGTSFVDKWYGPRTTLGGLSRDYRSTRTY